MNATANSCPPEARPLRILIVDDQPALRKLIRLILTPAGCEIEEAADGWAGEQVFRARPADLVLCDLFMPGRDGLEVLRALSREFSSVKFVMMSGGGDFHGTVNLLPLATSLGAAGVLRKPFGPSELLSAVRQALGVNPNDTRSI